MTHRECKRLKRLPYTMPGVVRSSGFITFRSHFCHNLKNQTTNITEQQVSLFGNSKGIAIWHMQTMANSKQVQITRGQHPFIEERRKLQGVFVVNKSSLEAREFEVVTPSY